MKKALIFLLIVSVATVAYCAATQIYVTFNVTNDDGQSVEDSRVEAFFLKGGVTDRDEGLTNESGNVTLAGTGPLGLDFRITKEGYYESVGGKASGSQSIDIVLREIRNPIAMYVRKIDVMRSEWQGEWVKFDFLLGDFLPPHGQGQVSDMEVLWDFEKEDFWSVKTDLYVRFPGQGNGLSRFGLDEAVSYSKFHSSYEAPVEQYTSEKHFFTYVAGQGAPVETNFEKNKANYYFRIRSQLDDEGNIFSAYYGKIYGDFNSTRGFPYYVNPIPNDRNMEFDPRQNLFADLLREESVSAP